LLTKHGLTSQQIEGKTFFFRGAHVRDAEETVCFYSERVLVYSPRREWMREWFFLLTREGDNGPLRPALDLAAGGRHHPVAGFAPPRPMLDQFVNGLLDPPPGVPPEHLRGRPDPRPLAEIQTADLTADLMSRADGAAADGIEVEARLRFPDSAAALKGR